MNLRMKLAMAFLLLIIVPMCALGIGMFLVTSHTIEKNTISSLNMHFRRLAIISRMFFNRSTMSRTMVLPHRYSRWH